MITKRHWVVIIVLGITVSAAWYYGMAQLDGNKQLYARRLLPSEVGGWSGVDLPVSKPVTDTLRTTDVLERAFSKSGVRDVIFSVVFAMDDRTAVHAPEECMVGGGREITCRNVVKYPVRLPRDTSEISPDAGELPPDMPLGDTIDLEVVELVLSSDKGITLVHFFYKCSQKVTPNYVQHEWDMLMSNLASGRSTNALVKTSTMVAAPGGEREMLEARARCKEVMQLMFPYVMRALP